MNKVKDIIKGALIYACLSSLYQDIVYKDAQGMIDHLLEGGWTDRAKTIPVAIIILIGIVIDQIQEYRKWRKR